MDQCFFIIIMYSYYSTVTTCYLIWEREHAKYHSVLHMRFSYYALVSRFEDTEAIMKGIAVV